MDIVLRRIIETMHPASLDYFLDCTNCVRATALVEGEVAEVLKVHYLVNVECDHESKRDNPVCNCGLVNLGWHDNIGLAINAWVAHVIAVLNEGG